ncbi:MAG: uncharacterized protein KVP18_003999 [Porospora cf. gigantea A]|uniref:uncharacterized protein n=2 Tax=Porospora cf. gigantea A TaxID=2853593 RepID=UPI00355A117C|nr:MAG: hypothetical protein KVP18_003999 [Porospora cf. gigantea A]
MENLPESAVRVCNAFQATYSGDSESMKGAEEMLKMLHLKPETPALLMGIIANEFPLPECMSDAAEGGIPSASRLAAAVFLKNEIRKYWKADEECEHYSDVAKAPFYQNVFRLMTMYPYESSVKETMLESCRLAVIADFPETCGSFASQAFDAITQRDDLTKVVCGLQLLCGILSKYEYRAIQETDRVLLEALVERFFPVMLQLIRDVQALPGGIFASDETCRIVQIAMKAHWSCTQIALSRGDEIIRSFDSWMEVFHLVIQTAVPESYMQRTSSDQPTVLPLKTKKWAYQSVHRMFSRFACPASSKAADGIERKMGEQFLKTWSLSSLELVVGQLLASQRGEIFLGTKLENLCLQIAGKGVELSMLYKALKAHVRPLLFDVCFKFMCYQKSDVELWIADPSEFIRQANDILKFFQSPREAAREFLQLICRLRGKDWLEEILQFCNTVLAEARAAEPLQANNPVCPRVDGALQMVGCIADRLSRQKRKLVIEPFIMNYVYPQLQSTDPLLRFRALHTIASFTENEELVPCPINNLENLRLLYNRIFELCADQELPVRAQAGNSLSCFFRFEQLKPLITSQLPQLMETIFCLLSEFDSEIIVSSLDTLVHQYEQHVPAFAERLLSCLSQHLERLIDGQALDMDDEAYITAMSLSQTILTVLQALADSGRKQEWVAVQEILMPLLTKILVPEQITYIEDAIQMCAFLTYYTPTIDASQWILFERLYSSLCGGSFPHLQANESWAPDYFFKMVSVFDNMISRDKETWLTGHATMHDGQTATYSQMTVKIISTMLTMDNTFVREAHRHAIELLSIVFEAFVNDRRIDSLVEPSICLVWDYCKEKEFNLGPKTRSMICRFYCMVMLYSGQTTFEVLQTKGITEPVISVFTTADVCHNLDAKRTAILAMCFILQNLEEPYMPSNVFQSAGVLCEGVTRVFETYMTEKLKQVERKDGDDYDEDSEQELDEDQDAAMSAHENLLMQLQDTKMDWDDDDEDFPEHYDGSFECCTESSQRFSAVVGVDETRLLAQCVEQKQVLFQTVLGPRLPALQQQLMLALQS